MTYEIALSEARQGCCDRWPKPCGYHEGYGDGYEHAERDTAAPEMLAALELYVEHGDCPMVTAAIEAAVDQARTEAKGEL